MTHAQGLLYWFIGVVLQRFVGLLWGMVCGDGRGMGCCGGMDFFWVVGHGVVILLLHGVCIVVSDWCICCLSRCISRQSTPNNMMMMLLTPS